MKHVVAATVAAVSCVLFSATSALALSENFSSNPLSGGSGWSFGIGQNNSVQTGAGVTQQFEWTAQSPQYAGDATGALTVHLNSSLPTARLDHPLGTTLTDTSSFQLKSDFSINVTNAPSDQFMQIAFGLTNSSSTGGDRTGSFANFSSDNTFNTVEFDYFPNASSFGPALTPTIFGGQEPGTDAFNNFAFVGASAGNLGDNATGIKALANNTNFEAQLDYDGTSKTATLSMFLVHADGSLELLDTGLVPLTLTASTLNNFYDLFNPFQVDTLSIMAYNDGFTTPATLASGIYTPDSNPSLAADITFQRLVLTTDAVAVPEPASGLLLVVGAALLFAVAHFRNRSPRAVAHQVTSGSMP